MSYLISAFPLLPNRPWIGVMLILHMLCNYSVMPQQLPQSETGLPYNEPLSFLEVSKQNGYPGEEVEVITEDGYILSLYHIPGNRSRPVLMVHGNTPTANCWIVRGNISLAITMASQGYDVWAINLRGTTFSRRHVTLNPDTQAAQFFDFTFYEQGVYDLAATIDLILNKTGQSQLLTIGHSVGTTVMYVLGAERPEYNEKIKLAVSLAPICFLQNVRGLTTIPLFFSPLLTAASDVLNSQELASYPQILPILNLFCRQPLGYSLCVKLAVFGIMGSDTDGFEPEFTEPFFRQWPGGSSSKTFKHLIQMSKGDKFAKFDYGFLRNLAVYGQLQPPELDLGKVTMKSALFVGKADFLSGIKDTERLNRSLTNVVHYQVMPYENFNHADFVWGRNMDTNLYPYLFNVIENYV